MKQGVTFLALGNGAPDVFSAMAAFSHPQTAGLAVGALFGESSALLNLHQTSLLSLACLFHCIIEDNAWTSIDFFFIFFKFYIMIIFSVTYHYHFCHQKCVQNNL